MKTYILAISLTMAFVSFAQDDYSTYVGGDIQVVTKAGKSQGDIYLETGKDLGIILKGEQKAKFVYFIKDIYAKSCKYDSIAKANNILDMDSKYYGDMKVRGYFRYGDWKFGDSQLQLIFTLKEGKSASYFYGSKMTASDNQFMKSESMFLKLDKQFVDELSSKLSDKAIKEFIESKNKVDSLFDD
tara:strand:- start:64 stop:621 length:558 start_codon:yes stop_codon:yes gene_type:complete